MKTLTIRLPDLLAKQIELESQARRVSKSDIVRERLAAMPPSAAPSGNMSDLAGDLIGSVQGLPPDLSSNKKKYLPDLIRAKNHHRR